MSLDNALSLAYVVTEAAVVGLLLYRRVWRSLPVLCAYCAWDLFSTAVLSYVILRFFPARYLTAYLTAMIVDSGLVFGVLIELAWSVFRPFRASLPRGFLAMVAGLVMVLGAVIWPFAVIPGFSYLPPEWHLLMRLQQTVSILQVLFFLLLVGCGQLLFDRLARSRVASGHRAWLLFPCQPWRGDVAYTPRCVVAVRSPEPGRSGQLRLLLDVLGLQFRAERGRASRIHSPNAESPPGCRRSCKIHSRRTDGLYCRQIE